MKARSLAGKRIMVTRAREQAGAFLDMLKAEGAVPVLVPTIEILPPKDWRPLDEAIKVLAGYDWIIFTSVNAVEAFFSRLAHAGKGKETLGRRNIAAVGTSTAEALYSKGVEAGVIPASYTAIALAKAMGTELLKGKRILMPRSDIAPKTLVNELKGYGAKVDDVPAYHTAAADASRQTAIEALRDGKVDVVTFTSSSTVDNFFLLLGVDGHKYLGKITIACIGPITAKTAEAHGLKVDVLAEEHTTAGLMSALERWAEKEVR